MERAMRASEDGWQEVVMRDPSGRRGLWMRVTGTTVELCAGREGDDAYVKLEGADSGAVRDVILCGMPPED